LRKALDRARRPTDPGRNPGSQKAGGSL